MTILEKLHAIDKAIILRQDLLSELEGVIFEYDDNDQDSVDNAHTIYEILIDLYPEIAEDTKEKEKSKKQDKEEKVSENAEEPIGEAQVAEQNKKDKKKKKKKKLKVVVEALEREDQKTKEGKEDKTEDGVRESTPSAKEKKKITKENKDTCKAVITEIKGVLSKFQESKKPKKPVRKKALAVVVKESVVVIIKRVLEREKRVNPEKHIDTRKFTSVITKGKDFLKALRKASGGISDDNDQMITSFENQVNEILASIEKKQEESKEAA